MDNRINQEAFPLWREGNQKGKRMNKHNWREWQIGDVIKFSWNEFDGCGSCIGKVITKEPDHLIVLSDDVHLWVDDDFKEMFVKLN